MGRSRASMEGESRASIFGEIIKEKGENFWKYLLDSLAALSLCSTRTRAARNTTHRAPRSSAAPRQCSLVLARATLARSSTLLASQASILQHSSCALARLCRLYHSCVGFFGDAIVKTV